MTKINLSGFVLVFLILSACSQSTETQNPVSSGKDQSPHKSTTATLPELPYKRIQAIVEKNGAEAEIYDRNSNMTPEKAVPPFDVMIITTADSCSGAKQLAWNITRDLYTDSISAQATERVKVMVTGYLTTSLGSDYASKMTEAMWKVGSSIFFEAVQSESSKEIFSSKEISTSKITFGVTDSGCRE